MEDRMNAQPEFRVVINDEKQYSIWWPDRELPFGWKEAGFSGTREQCLEHVQTVWTDMRPWSLRLRMDALTEPSSGEENDGVG